MWYLISESRPDEKHVFLCGKEYVFGRKDCDIVLSGDPSVSRKHASIQVTHSDTNVANPDKQPIIQLKDLSKFGTFVGSKKVEDSILLQDGNTVFFGSPKSGFMVVYEPFIITTSCLDSASKKLTRSIMKNLGAHVVNEYRSDCNLLIMNSISVTIKVVCALINQNCIVTPNYLENYQKYLQGNGEIPDPKNYLPTVIESQVDSEKVSFLPDIKRRNVFRKMRFIFFCSKQFNKMKLAITLSNGIPLLLEDGLKENDKSMLYEPGTIVMAPNEAVKTLPAATQEFYHQVNQIFSKKEKTMIGDSEVGYAVLYCSTEKHCNPDIPQPSQISHEIKSQSLSTDVTFDNSDILAYNTEISKQGKKEKKNFDDDGGIKVIDETFLANKETERKSLRTPKNRSNNATTYTEPSTPQQIKDIKEEPVTPAKTSSQNKSKTVPSQDIKIELPSISKRHRSPSPHHISNIDTPAGDASIDLEAASEVISPQDKRNKKTAIPDAKRKRISRSPSPVTVTRANRCNKSPSAVPDTERSSTSVVSTSRSKRTRSPSPAEGEGRPSKRTRSPSPVRESVKQKKKDVKREVKEEEITIINDTDDNQQSERDGAKQIRLADGFLTTRKPLKSQTVKNEEYVYESDLPERLIVTSFTDLIKRKTSNQTSATRGEAIPDGYIKWKGQLVKNFKKFKKVAHAGCHTLPNIIGGSDLQVHMAEKSKEIEDWFQQSMRTESQLNEEEKQIQELFDYRPSHSRKVQ